MRNRDEEAIIKSKNRNNPLQDGASFALFRFFEQSHYPFGNGAS